MTKNQGETPPAAEQSAIRQPFIGEVVWYNPLEHHARAVPGPWAAVVIGFDSIRDVKLAVMPPDPLPVGTYPVERVEGVKYSDNAEFGTWSWPKR